MSVERGGGEIWGIMEGTRLEKKTKTEASTVKQARGEEGNTSLYKRSYHIKSHLYHT